MRHRLRSDSSLAAHIDGGGYRFAPRACDSRSSRVRIRSRCSNRVGTCRHRPTNSARSGAESEGRAARLSGTPMWPENPHTTVPLLEDDRIAQHRSRDHIMAANSSRMDALGGFSAAAHFGKSSVFYAKTPVEIASNVTARINAAVMDHSMTPGHWQRKQRACARCFGATQNRKHALPWMAGACQRRRRGKIPYEPNRVGTWAGRAPLFERQA